MGVAGVMFELHLPNFEKYTTFKDVQMTLKHFFDISTGFQYKKWKGVLRPSIETSMSRHASCCQILKTFHGIPPLFQHTECIFKHRAN